MNELRLFDPFGMEPLEDSLRQMFKPWKFQEAAPAIKMDVSETEQAYAVKAEIPGVKKEDIEVRVDGKQVTISAEVKHESEDKQDGRVLRSERRYGYASRSFMLACPVDDAKTEARYEDGVLRLTLPKKTTTPNARVVVQ